IRKQADKLLGPQVADVDGNVEERRGTVSVFNGPPPNIRTYDSPEEESKAVGEWLKNINADGIVSSEIGVFVRSAAQLDRAKAALDESGLEYNILDERMQLEPGKVSVSTMHLAKGLEFRAVAVMACDDEVIPLQDRIESITDNADLEEVYDTERHLLYVACTRARDHLLISGVDPVSEFVDDLNS
ncbi:MAG: DNA helicase, partial [Gammaproteobacteria bacterium]|nr:DNA helicase [Gammaproteobacteria bacterium]